MRLGQTHQCRNMVRLKVQNPVEQLDAAFNRLKRSLFQFEMGAAAKLRYGIMRADFAARAQPSELISTTGYGRYVVRLRLKAAQNATKPIDGLRYCRITRRFIRPNGSNQFVLRDRPFARSAKRCQGTELFLGKRNVHTSVGQVTLTEIHREPAKLKNFIHRSAFQSVISRYQVKTNTSVLTASRM